MRQLYGKKIEAARLSFECAGELGKVEAYYILACLYEFGVGIDVAVVDCRAVGIRLKVLHHLLVEILGVALLATEAVLIHHLPAPA